MTSNFKLKVYDNKNIIGEFDILNYDNSYIKNEDELVNLKKYINLIEYTFIIQKIHNLMNNNSQNYKLKKFYNDFFCEENHDLIKFYNELVNINNIEYSLEVKVFNDKRTKFLDTYTGEIEFENEYFQPYEYLIFLDSNTLKKKYYHEDFFGGCIDKYYFSSYNSIISLENYKDYEILLNLIFDSNYSYVIESIK
jgi:hypothetical protein